MTSRDLSTTASSGPEPDRNAVIDAINQMFAEFELVYHNQFSKAFPNEEKLSYAKKLWYSNLRHLQPGQILDATHRAIRESEYLPTVRGILKYCTESLGLPSAHDAYIEACQAPSPKAGYRWSHPAVYHAGQQSDWYFLANTPENRAFPVFRQHYEALCQQVMAGQTLAPPAPLALAEETHTPLSNAERRQRLRALREELDI